MDEVLLIKSGGPVDLLSYPLFYCHYMLWWVERLDVLHFWSGLYAFFGKQTQLRVYKIIIMIKNIGGLDFERNKSN